MKIKKWFTLISLFALLLASVSAVGAQDVTPAPAAQSPAVQAVRMIGDIVAQETGLTTGEILQQLWDGQTLADIITANGGDVQSVIDQSVSQLTDAINQAVQKGSITQERANDLLSGLQDRVTRLVNGTLFPNRLDRAAVRRQYERILAQATADATGLNVSQIVEQLAQGKTLADIITANGGNVDTVVNNAITAATDQINAAVKDNRLGQEQADVLIASLPTLLTDAVNGQLGHQALQRLVSAAVIRLAGDQTGLTPQQIREEIRSGKSLADVLTEHGVDTNAFIDSAAAQVKERLDQAVTNKRITQERADQLLNDFRTRLTERINQAGTPEATATPG